MSHDVSAFVILVSWASSSLEAMAAGFSSFLSVSTTHTAHDTGYANLKFQIQVSSKSNDLQIPWATQLDKN